MRFGIDTLGMTADEAGKRLKMSIFEVFEADDPGQEDWQRGHDKKMQEQ